MIQIVKHMEVFRFYFINFSHINYNGLWMQQTMYHQLKNKSH